MGGKDTLGVKLVLWDFQRQIVDVALKRKNVIVVLPQGTGKTVIGLTLIKEGAFKKALILVHRKNLINSWVEKGCRMAFGRFVCCRGGYEVGRKKRGLWESGGYFIDCTIAS